MRAFPQCPAALRNTELRATEGTTPRAIVAPYADLRCGRSSLARRPALSTAQGLRSSGPPGCCGRVGSSACAGWGISSRGGRNQRGGGGRAAPPKSRPAKPFAVMVSSLDEARDLAEIDTVEARLLSSRTARGPAPRPVPKPACSSVAPHLDTIGVMLPSTPLHVLLLDQVRRPLVMTSGNRSEEPIAAANAKRATVWGASSTDSCSTTGKSPSAVTTPWFG